jgi:hypothetical protein
MKIVCAWCGAFMGIKKPIDNLVSHSCCKKCEEIVRGDMKNAVCSLAVLEKKRHQELVDNA